MYKASHILVSHSEAVSSTRTMCREEALFLAGAISEEIRTSTDGQYYPENNLIISDPMIFRGVVVKQITFYPFRLDLESGDIEVYNNVDVNIEEITTDLYRDYYQTKLLYHTQQQVVGGI